MASNDLLKVCLCIAPDLARSNLTSRFTELIKDGIGLPAIMYRCMHRSCKALYLSVVWHCAPLQALPECAQACHQPLVCWYTTSVIDFLPLCSCRCCTSQALQPSNLPSRARSTTGSSCPCWQASSTVEMPAAKQSQQTLEACMPSNWWRMYLGIQAAISAWTSTRPRPQAVRQSPRQSATTKPTSDSRFTR